VTPAFNWDNGFPLSFPTFPIIDPTLDNNGTITYVDRNDNRPEMAQNIGGEPAFPRVKGQPHLNFENIQTPRRIRAYQLLSDPRTHRNRAATNLIGPVSIMSFTA
jgi:hypothetical protein